MDEKNEASHLLLAGRYITPFRHCNDIIGLTIGAFTEYLHNDIFISYVVDIILYCKPGKEDTYNITISKL